MSTFNESDHPRAGSGQFTNKEGSSPEVGLPRVTNYQASELANMSDDERRAAARQNFDAFQSQGLSLAESAERADKTAIYPETKEERQHGMSRRRYSSDVRRIFGEELADAYGLDDLTAEQKEKAFDRAWETGHSSGWRAVETDYEELADLVNFIRPRG